MLIPIAAARFPIDRPSSPSTVAMDAASRRIALRVRSPSERCRRCLTLPGRVISLIVI